MIRLWPRWTTEVPRQHGVFPSRVVSSDGPSPTLAQGFLLVKLVQSTLAPATCDEILEASRAIGELRSGRVSIGGSQVSAKDRAKKL